jgi:hypothetical protein
MESLYVAQEIPEGAAILLVDIEEVFIQKALEAAREQERPTLLRKLQERLEDMKKYLLELKANGHTIYATFGEKGIYPGFEDIPDSELDKWEMGTNGNRSWDDTDNIIFNNDIVRALEDEEMVIVCGLWKERCVYRVTRMLLREGISSALCLDPRLTIELSFAFDVSVSDFPTLYHSIRNDCVDLMVIPLPADVESLEEDEEEPWVCIEDKKTSFSEPHGRGIFFKLINVDNI